MTAGNGISIQLVFFLAKPKEKTRSSKALYTFFKTLSRAKFLEAFTLCYIDVMSFIFLIKWNKKSIAYNPIPK
jgi:hypothetical protein